MNHLVIGLGEVGSAIYELLAIDGGYEVVTLDKKNETIDKKISVLHICFPASKDFVPQTKKYINRFQPKLVIVYSTVPVGTCVKLGNNVVHSPIEGKHPRLYFSTKVFNRWIGYNNLEAGELAKKIWKPLTKNKIRLVPGTEVTEFLKLASTSKYGINIVWARYMADVCIRLGMDYENVKQWDEDYNALYTRLGMKGARKFVLDPPEGKIGGHCVRENAIILDEQFPNTMLKMIKEVGIK